MKFLFAKIFFFGCTVSALSTHAQFKNIIVDTSTPNNRVSSPGIAISLKDPNVMVATSEMDNVYTTSDGGQTWSKSKLTSSLGVWGSPVIISDFNGTFHYFHLSDPTGKNTASEEALDRIVVQQSDDNGKTWSDGSSIGLNPPKDQSKERVAVDRKGNLFVSWTQFDAYGSHDTSCQSNILLSRSSNGKKWSAPIVISQTPGGCMDDGNTAASATPAVTGDGKYSFVAWTNQGNIFFDRSMDGGLTWLRNDIVVAEQQAGWNMEIPGIHKLHGMPVLVCDNTKRGTRLGVLYLVWADQQSGTNDTDIWFSRSVNFGDNWTPPMRVNSSAKNTHQFLPGVAVDPATGNLYIVYYDRGANNDTQTDVTLAYSTDGGNTFKNVKISEAPFMPTENVQAGVPVAISAYQGIIAPIWTRMDNGQTSVVTTIIKQEELEKLK